MKRLLLSGLLALVPACGDATNSPDFDGGTVDAGRMSGLTAEQQEWLTAHDAVRANAMPVPSPALEATHWSATAQAQADEWAARCDFTHRDPNTLGENLFASSGARTPTSIVNSWAAESANYTYSSNSCALTKQCGHYTQIVWRRSTGVACSMKTCTSGSPFGSGTWFFTVCNYEPAGNIVGQNPY
jgi:pathogenesis-related protein 1